jgi:hypothetical protein
MMIVSCVISYSCEVDLLVFLVSSYDGIYDVGQCSKMVKTIIMVSFIVGSGLTGRHFARMMMQVRKD